MRSIRNFKARLREALARDQKGMALFMVITAMTILSVVGGELAYVSQVNQRMAFDGVDQVRALYLAKTGFKLSLLRLKAYQTLKGLAGDKNIPIKLPKGILEKVWEFPFVYPLPTNIPGLDPRTRDQIEEFQKESALMGNFTAVIESESSRFNLNLILGDFGPKTDAATGTATGTSTGTGTSVATAPPPTTTSPRTGTATGTSTDAFNPEEARKGLRDLIGQILENEFEKDPDLRDQYRDPNLAEEITDGIVAWADRAYERKLNIGREQIKLKQAPFYSVGELRMVHPMDDKLYELLAPNFTASTTPGVNVNTIKESVLRTLIPGITDEEVKEFYKFRDDPEEDNKFKSADDFFKWIQEHVAQAGGEKGTSTLKEDFAKRRIRIVTEEDTFKITVQAQVNSATRVIEAIVMLVDPKAGTGSGGAGNQGRGAGTNPNDPNNPGTQGQDPGTGTSTGTQTGDNHPSGLRITFMRIL